MFSFPNKTKVYLRVKPVVDMRKSFNGLWSEASNLKKIRLAVPCSCLPINGTIGIKVLYWDGKGVWICAKRLEKGRFTAPMVATPRKLSLTGQSLGMLLDGIEYLKQGCKKAWYER